MSLKELITRILNRLDTDTITEQYDFSRISFTAGTIGTRGSQYTANITKTGYTPVSATIIHISDSSSFHPLVFFGVSGNTTTLYANFYRATSAAYTASGLALSVRVVYKKN